ncbi:MAG TPA: trp operon repressor [Gammaproteobacteria bacterium]|nr:trp operon repressor [Gammaproteobacteria bacterium]
MIKPKAGWQTFLDLCLGLENPKELSSLLDLLLTPEEKDNLAMRCLIVQALLQKRHTQREIAENLQVSIAKITRGSNELKRMPAKLLEYLRDNLNGYHHNTCHPERKRRMTVK